MTEIWASPFAWHVEQVSLAFFLAFMWHYITFYFGGIAHRTREALEQH